MTESNLDLGVIGNCSIAALIDRIGRIVWGCLPRFDGDPVFCHLLNDAGGGASGARGLYQIELDKFARSEQRYASNTAILITELHDADGGRLEVVDFAPRFGQFGRTYRPMMIVRLLRPVAGVPRIRIVLRPSASHGSAEPQITHGSNHIRYVGTNVTLRLTTNAPPAYILDETPFFIEEPIALILGPDETLSGPPLRTAQELFERTQEYWREWVRGLALSLEWQDAVIRAAITIKLCSFEETGAIVAAMTTSIPESANSGRNWDYRYCWLRDAFFVVRALNRLGAVPILENYLRYLTNIVAGAEHGQVQPVYGIALERRLPEREIATLAGYRGMGPVRIGNKAFEQQQHDVYGDVVLATTQAFFDQRLLRPADSLDFERLERMGERAVLLHAEPDASIWERRTLKRVHTASSVMCWAACDRLAKIAAHIGLDDRARYWREQTDRIRSGVESRAWNGQMNSFVGSFDGDDIDASLLLMVEVGFVRPDDPRFQGTLAAIERSLRRGTHLMRYATPDDFGAPSTSFIICTFWYIETLAAIGRLDEARELFETLLGLRNHLGLLSEDIDVDTGELWGNFPQTYSQVGLINCAIRLSRRWETML